MARTKSLSLYDNNNKISSTTKIYKVGAYLRLSKEDAYGGVSTSIDNQGKIIQTFLENNPLEFELAETYVDDGLTGVTDDRINFQRMIEDCKIGAINCIIVKDGSRFARNHADCEYYVEEFFKINNIRFICLDAPRVDSVKDPSSVSGMQFHFTNYFNEYFVKQTSEKILQTFGDKRKRGEFIGSFAPYGYKKDPNNKHKLIVDEEAASIVVKIFDLFVNEGYSIRQIGIDFNSKGIPSKLQYMRANGDKVMPLSQPKVYAWQHSSVRKILKDERYLGHMVQGKSARVSYKNKKLINKPEEEWVKVYNTHEAIIDGELFAKAQTMLTRATRVSPAGQRHKYSGFLYCGKCGHSITAKRSGRNREIGYVCKFYQNTKMCEPLHITKASLDERVLYAVRSQLVMLTDMQNIYDNIVQSEQYADDSKILQTSLKKLEQSLQSLDLKNQRLYDSYDDRVISKELFTSRSKSLEIEIGDVRNKIYKIKKEIRQYKTVTRKTSDYLDTFKKYENIDTIDRELLVELVDKIMVENLNDLPRRKNSTAKKVTIIFNFQNEYRALEQFISENRLVSF